MAQAKKDKQDLEEKKKRAQAIKSIEMGKKRNESLQRIVNSIKGPIDIENGLESDNDLKKQLMKCKLDDIKNAFHHCGGNLKNQTDQKKETIATALSCNPLFLASLSNPDNNHNTNGSVNVVVNNTLNENKDSTETVETTMVTESDKGNVAVV